MKTLLLAIVMILVAINAMAADVQPLITVHVAGTVYKYENGDWSVMYGIMAVVPEKVTMVTTDQPILIGTCRGECLVPAHSIVFFVPAVDGLYNTHIYGKGSITYDINMDGFKS